MGLARFLLRARAAQPARAVQGPSVNRNNRRIAPAIQGRPTSMARIGGCYNIADFQWQARKRLPTPLYHYIEGGADDELTRAANTAAFDRYALVPDYLHDIRSIDMRRTVLGRERSEEERRVGNECVSTWRSRWAP